MKQYQRTSINNEFFLTMNFSWYVKINLKPVEIFYANILSMGNEKSEEKF